MWWVSSQICHCFHLPKYWGTTLIVSVKFKRFWGNWIVNILFNFHGYLLQIQNGTKSQFTVANATFFLLAVSKMLLGILCFEKCLFHIRFKNASLTGAIIVTQQTNCWHCSVFLCQWVLGLFCQKLFRRHLGQVCCTTDLCGKEHLL